MKEDVIKRWEKMKSLKDERRCYKKMREDEIVRKMKEDLIKDEKMKNEKLKMKYLWSKDKNEKIELKIYRWSIKDERKMMRR